MKLGNKAPQKILFTINQASNYFHIQAEKKRKKKKSFKILKKKKEEKSRNHCLEDKYTSFIQTQKRLFAEQCSNLRGIRNGDSIPWDREPNHIP